MDRTEPIPPALFAALAALIVPGDLRTTLTLLAAR